MEEGKTRVLAILDLRSSIFVFGRVENSLFSSRSLGYTRQEVVWNFHQKQKSLPMRWYRSLLLPMVVGVGIIVAGALGQQTAPPTPAAPGAQSTPPAKPPTPPTPPTPDAAGTKILEEALQAKRLDWVQTTLWQQVDIQGLSFQAEGTYLSAPDNRLHLSLLVHVGDTTGKLETISDGTTLWETMQVGDGDRTIEKKVSLKEVLDSLNKPEMAKEMRDEFLESQSFYGVVPLLKSIRERMVVTKKEEAKWHGLDVTVLTADWTYDIVKQITLDGKQPWRAFFPRQCRLFLDAKTRWPHRIEWIGPIPGKEQDGIILQMEFRNPKHEVLSPEVCKKEFTFDPGKAKVPTQADITEQLKDAVRYRNQQLTAQRGKTNSSK